MKKDIRVPLYGIKRLSFNTDGDGIRTLVCFKGCPLKCKYCINPESRTINIDDVTVCVDELFDMVSVDSIYFEATAGGITFGGGEPLLYPEFIIEFINKENKNWNYWIETSLNVPYSNIELVMNKVDKFIIDIKSINDDIYFCYTGEHNNVVIKNLERLINDVGKDKIIVRVPYIEGYTDRDDLSTVEYLRSVGIDSIDIFDYVIIK